MNHGFDLTFLKKKQNIEQGKIKIFIPFDKIQFLFDRLYNSP